MKNPYAPGFWCAIAALVLLSATYFYGIMLAHQIDKALIFLDSASALIAVLSIVVVAWASVQGTRIKKKHLEDPGAYLGHQGGFAPG
jgi:membrane protein DedA with SNARE-associated domain